MVFNDNVVCAGQSLAEPIGIGIGIKCETMGARQHTDREGSPTMSTITTTTHSHNLTGAEVAWVPCETLTHCPALCECPEGAECATVRPLAALIADVRSTALELGQLEAQGDTVPVELLAEWIAQHSAAFDAARAAERALIAHVLIAEVSA